MNKLNYKILNNHIFSHADVLDLLEKHDDLNVQIYYKWGTQELDAYFRSVMFNDELPSTMFTLNELGVLFRIQKAHSLQFPAIVQKDIFDFTF